MKEIVKRCHICARNAYVYSLKEDPPAASLTYGTRQSCCLCRMGQQEGEKPFFTQAMRLQAVN